MSVRVQLPPASTAGLVARTAEAAREFGRVAPEFALVCARLSLPPFSRLFRSYRIIGAASGPSTNRGRRGGRADDDARVTSFARRRRSLVAGREGRGAAPVISTAEDISSRDCRGAVASKRQRPRRRRRKRGALIGETAQGPPDQRADHVATSDSVGKLLRA